jgi:hypothetical protein
MSSVNFDGSLPCCSRMFYLQWSVKSVLRSERPINRPSRIISSMNGISEQITLTLLVFVVVVTIC